MRRLLLLFPLYILFLSGLPCSPDDGCCPEEIQAAAHAGKSDHHQSNDHKTALPCSPFFPCGACHGFVLPNLTFRVIHPPAPIAKRSTLYVEKPLLVFTTSIWQPPKQA